MKMGIMGGSFNPIHMGHLMMSEYMRSHLGLSKVLFIPTGNAPHKRDYSVSAKERLKMVEIAVADNPYFEVSDVEVTRKNTMYSVDTLNILKETYPDAEFYFFLGSDILQDLKSWKKFRELAQMTRFAVAVRPGFQSISMANIRKEIQFLTHHYGADIVLIDTPRLEISSTNLRNRIRQGKSVKYFLPDDVRTYVWKKRFYRQ
ncbi:MAG: nicotinate-nucleotide adenylyltransferase [Peptoniphilus sp.]|nr:nicotinate-nucleotide adenylyltransferase [Peptoniphilus sp.]MDD7363691.1 nicotinate-nucleotide adenylyltransferase [Bacillota bacterium]MDY6044076.1 nicotinate-nucleotide adenylyltransferase [Peptoniphilus sp.]